jgi:ABC-type uncharacterized transport system substrate-binding protein
MTRREFLAVMLALPLAAPMASHAQQGKVWRIGVLTLRSGPGKPDEAFRAGMRDLGYVEGQNLVIEYRWGAGEEDRLPALATELVRLNVDALLTAGAQTTQAAKAATSTIPIVIASVNDPVSRGFVASLSHPAGNITGLTTLSEDIAAKRLQMLKEVTPRVSRVAVFVSPLGDPTRTALIKAAKPMGIQLQFVVVPERAQDLEGAYAAMAESRAEALYVDLNPRTGNLAQDIVDLAARHRLPAIYETKGFVDAGGLIAYGPSIPDMYRRAASYVDKLFKGAKPADLPMEQPTKFELAINLKTAQALGLTISQALLLRADEVIQ